MYIHDGAIEALVRAKLSSTNLFVSANLVNHPRLSHVHQKRGLVHADSICQFTDDPWGYSGYADWRCASIIHESFLSDLEDGRAHLWTTLNDTSDNVFEFHDVHASNFTRWSINAMAMQLKDLGSITTNAAAAELLINDEQVSC